MVVAVKAIACELPARLGLPFSHLHDPDIQAEVAAAVWSFLSPA